MQHTPRHKDETSMLSMNAKLRTSKALEVKHVKSHTNYTQIYAQLET